MYKYYNKNSKNKFVDDCTVRAISTVTNRTWDETYRELSDLARRKGMMFDSVDFIEDYLDDRYPRECHYARYVGEFVDEHPIGRYLITMNNHITCCINGTLYDTFDCRDRVMRCAWKIK